MRLFCVLVFLAACAPRQHHQLMSPVDQVESATSAIIAPRPDRLGTPGVVEVLGRDAADRLFQIAQGDIVFLAGPNTFATATQADGSVIITYTNVYYTNWSLKPIGGKMTVVRVDGDWRVLEVRNSRPTFDYDNDRVAWSTSEPCSEEAAAVIPGLTCESEARVVLVRFASTALMEYTDLLHPQKE